ncbi:PREDICTED: zeatin O-glucosyltransferase-like [Ipomoea nil]|uniref:zeatin O-glucosyltransferase-like n=1 Tax=Ipomoea nil TaxID=35883 RepID=UPI0009015C95|nr:PREDICTED: zeatin O-glucosyltransferase-like [Ipomoea nil]
MASVNSARKYDTKRSDKVIVVVVPFVAQGHLNLLVHLSRLIASYNLPVYFVGLSVDIAAVKPRIEGWSPSDYPTLRFHEFPAPPAYLSNTNPTMECQSYLEFLASAMNAAAYLRSPIGSLLKELSPKCERLVVVHDALMVNTVKDAVVQNLETYNFFVGSAFHDASLVWEVLRKILHVPSFLWKLVGRFVLPAGAVVPDRLPIPSSCYPPEFFKFIVDQRKTNAFCKGNLFDACRAIEGPYLDLLAMVYKLARKGPVWGIGPFNPVVTKRNTKTDQDSSSKTPRHKCLEWLDKQPPKSVIFVSFGTQTVLSDHQLHELAEGLEQSGQNFIWVVKDLTKGYKNTKINLPAGFEERVEGRGLILRDWVPQLEILDHVSTGGFLTHCGWNSCMESMCRGVPLATWPIQYDQPRNAILITEVLKTGIPIKDWESRDEITTSTTIRNAIRRLMASPEGEELRNKAAEAGRAVKESVMEGGISRLEMDNFIAHITR